MASDELPAMQHLHQRVRDARLQRQSHQRVRHAVAMEVDLDVIVDVRLHRLEGGPLPGLCRQARQRRRIQRCEQARTAAFELLELAIVQRRQQCCDGSVGGVNVGQHGVAQPRQDPAGHHLDRTLGTGLIFWRKRTCWKE